MAAHRECAGDSAEVKQIQEGLRHLYWAVSDMEKRYCTKERKRCHVEHYEKRGQGVFDDATLQTCTKDLPWPSLRRPPIRGTAPPIPI